MNARLKIVPAVLGFLLAAAPAVAQGGATLAVGPDAGGYLCPDGRQLYVKSCYDNSPYANCGVLNMHLPLNRGQWQVETTETRANLVPSVAACKVYPVEFRNDGTVQLVLPKSVTTQQAAKAPAATPAPKVSTAAKAPATGETITIVAGMAIGRERIPSSLVRISTLDSGSPFYVDEASRRPTKQKDVVTIWVLQVWPGGNPSDASVSAAWTELNANCKQNTYEITFGILLDRQANALRTKAIYTSGTSAKKPKTETPSSIACQTTPPSKGPRFASANAAIADAIAGAAPKTAAKPAPIKLPAKAPIRLPKTESETKFFQAIKEGRTQAAIFVISDAPDGKTIPIAKLTDEEGMTALHWAAAKRNAAILRWLIDKGSEVDLADEKGRTPLKIALDNEDKQVMTLLLNIGDAHAGFALPGHDDELNGIKKTSDLVDFMIKAAGHAGN